MTEQELTAIDLWASGWAREGSAEFAAVTRLVGEYRVKTARIAELTEMNERLADRVSLQSDLRYCPRTVPDLLSRKAEGQRK